MKIETKFNIGDKVVRYHIRYDGILIHKCEIVEVILRDGETLYNIIHKDDIEKVRESDIYPINEIDKVLEIIKEKTIKGE